MTVLLESNKTMQKAHTLYEKFSTDQTKMEQLEAREKWQRDFNSRMKSSWRKGHFEGKEEGKKEEKFDIAKSMLVRKMDKSLIIDITGLSETEIKNLS